MLGHEANGLYICGQPSQGRESRRRDVKLGSQGGPEKRFCDGAAAVIAFAYDQDGFQREPCFRVSGSCGRGEKWDRRLPISEVADFGCGEGR